jgi:hypothetical protein
MKVVGLDRRLAACPPAPDPFLDSNLALSNTLRQKGDRRHPARSPAPP